jgi:hypothetical protein
MNNRILELARESHIDVYGLGKDRVKWEATLQAFAELLLEDIDKIITDMYHAYPLEQAVTLIDLDLNIKQNFYGTQNEDQTTK